MLKILKKILTLGGIIGDGGYFGKRASTIIRHGFTGVGAILSYSSAQVVIHGGVKDGLFFVAALSGDLLIIIGLTSSLEK